MTTAEFVRGLIRLTARGRARWRIPKRSKSGAQPVRAYLALGDYTFILTPYGPHPTLIEQGGWRRQATLVEAETEVRELAVFVTSWLQGTLRAVETVGAEEEAPEGWQELLRQARRVKTAAEEERDEVELWRRLGRG